MRERRSVPETSAGFDGAPVHLVDRPTVTPQQWRDLGASIAGQRHQMDGQASRQMWAVGDWLLQGEDEVYAQLNRRRVRTLAAEITGYSVHTLAMAVSLARRVPPAVRVDGLTWWHHLLIGKLPTAEQEAWLCRAAEEGWSAAVLRKRLRAASVIAGRPSSRRSDRLVSQLTMWKRSEMSDYALGQLREWWRREMESEPDPAPDGARIA